MKFLALTGRLAYGFGIVLATTTILTDGTSLWMSAGAGALMGVGAVLGWVD